MILNADQEYGAQWLANRVERAGRVSGLLGDVPGFGKTRTLLRALLLRGAKRPLVLAPAIAVSHWLRENALVRPGGDIAVVSYDYAVRNPRFSDFDALVLDESHLLKHATAKRTKLCLGAEGLARKVSLVYAASGTPVPRHPGELFTLLYTVFPWVLLEHGIKNVTQFKERFLIIRRALKRYGWDEKVVGLQNEEEFNTLLSKIMLRRTELAGVPGVQWNDPLVIDADTAALRLPPKVQQALERGEPLEQFLTDEHVARYRRNVGMAKAPAVIAKLRDELAESTEKVLVFAHHTDVLDALAAGLDEFGVAFVDGRVTGAARDAEIARFQTDPACRVFVGQNTACAMSVTLTAARRAILVEPDWAAWVNYQLGQRMARIGSTFSTCFAQMVSLAGTIDEAVVRQNVRETRMAQKLGGTQNARSV